MSDQTENTAELLKKAVDMNKVLLDQAASAYAYNKINNILLMQILAATESRDLEEIRNNVDKYITQFTDEFKKKYPLR